MNDALEILEDIKTIVNRKEGWANAHCLQDAIDSYIQQKRLEFVEPQGDCCG